MTRDEIDNLIYIASVVQLDGLDFARTFTVDEIAASFNGIGADWMSDKLRGKLTDWLGLFAPAAMIHDLRYTKSDGKRYGFNFANIEFHNNCLKLARWAYPIWRFLRRCLAENSALALYKAVCSEGGWKAWTDAAEKNAARNCATDTRTGAHETRTCADSTRTGASTLNDSNRP